MVVYPVTENFAAKIGDLDLSKTLSGQGRAEIEAAFNRCSVLVFPDQQLSTDQHLDFASNFGPLETTMHRGKGYDDLRWPRDMQCATVSDVAPTCEQEGIAVTAAA